MAEKIKWGILSTGNIAGLFAEGLKYVKDAELVAVASREESKAKAFADRFQIPKYYGSYEQLANDSNVDVIYVATPHNLHCENTLLCLEHGKHVLCEKPFAVNTGQVKRMIDLASRKKLFLMEALWSRFLPGIIKTKELINSGIIGDIRIMKVDFGISPVFDPKHRLFNPELIGGSLLDLGIYPVFLTLFLLGKPESINAVASIGATGVDYSCSFTFQYKNDLMSVMYSTAIARTATVAEIYGNQGDIVFDNFWFTPVNFTLKMKDGKSEKTNFNFVGNGYNYEAEEVVKCLQSGKTQSELMSWDRSLELIEVLDTIRRQIGLKYAGHDD